MYRRVNAKCLLLNFGCGRRIACSKGSWVTKVNRHDRMGRVITICHGSIRRWTSRLGSAQSLRDNPESRAQTPSSATTTKSSHRADDSTSECRHPSLPIVACLACPGAVETTHSQKV